MEYRDGVWSDVLDAGIPGGVTWSERIPQAIEKAEHMMNGVMPNAPSKEYQWMPNAVALAKALWEAEKTIEGEWGPWDDWPKSPALRAFVEKVEAL